MKLLAGPYARADSRGRPVAQFNDSLSRLAHTILPVREFGEEFADDGVEGGAPLSRVAANRANHIFIDAEVDVLH